MNVDWRQNCWANCAVRLWRPYMCLRRRTPAMQCKCCNLAAMECRCISLVIVVVLLVASAWSVPALPLPHEPEWHAPRAGAAELGTRLAAHAQRPPDARLPLPSPQELDAIKKVAQILIMLGEQVIPSIVGEPPSPPSACDPTLVDVPNDIVSDNS